MDDANDVPGARDVADVLSTDPIAKLLGTRIELPIVLGLTVALLAALAIVFGPSSDSRFIYTDF
jgi:hypothetical protein